MNSPSFLQTIRISYRVNHYQQLTKLLEVLRSQLNKRPVSVCVRFVRVAEGCNIYDPATIENVLQRAPAAIKTLSLYDFDDICQALVIFNYQSPSGADRSLLPILLQEIRDRVPEIAFSTKTFLSLVHNLTILGYHDHEIIENALRSDFLQTVFQGNEFLDNSVYGLSAYAEINLQNQYRGRLLSEKYKKKMKKISKVTAGVKDKVKVYNANRMFKTIMEILDESTTPYKVGFALPHFQAAGEPIEKYMWRRRYFLFITIFRHIHSCG